MRCLLSYEPRSELLAKRYDHPHHKKGRDTKRDEEQGKDDQDAEHRASRSGGGALRPLMRVLTQARQLGVLI